jgi:outer membrane protein OmpA-like peptidoglycan-associated protein
MRQLTLGLCLLGALVARQSWAENAGKWEYGAALGLGTYTGDVDKSGMGPYGDLRAHHWLSEKMALGLVVGGVRLSANESDNLRFKTPLLGLTGRLKYLPLGERSWTPYVTGGLEWVTFNAEDLEGSDDHAPQHDITVQSETTGMAVPLGLGLSHRLNENWLLTLEGIFHLSSTDWIDDLELNDDSDHWTTLSAGLAWFPGEAKPVDTDGDGIEDKLDRCPTRPEDKDSFEDSDGCPDPDNDKDGVLDEEDKCPDKPEIVNGYKDQDGCPDTKPEVQVEAGKSIVLEGVNFDSGKATLQAGSEEPLGKVLRTLQENPEITLQIQGHTDNQGKAQLNRELSQRRADTVKAWLVERGVEAARLEAKGFGPDKPLVDNGTADGRARNRRIEFLRLN